MANAPFSKAHSRRSRKRERYARCRCHRRSSRNPRRRFSNRSPRSRASGRSRNNQKAVYFLQNPNCHYTTQVTVTVASPGKVQFNSHPYTNNDAVMFSHGTLPTGLAIGTVYYVRNATTNDFELSAAVNGASINTTGSPGNAFISMSHFETSYVGKVGHTSANLLYMHNGTAALHQYHVRDMSGAATYVAAGSATVTVAAPGKVQLNAHGFALNDVVTFISGTLPTGLTIGTTYWVKNPTVNDFEVSATLIGASLTTTGSPGTAVVGRANGISHGQWLYKTGFLPALTGALLATDSEKIAIPVAGHINIGVLGGNPCAALATASNLYIGLLSDLTSNVTSWPSLTTSLARMASIASRTRWSSVTIWRALR